MKKTSSSITARAALGALFLIASVVLVLLAVNINVLNNGASGTINAAAAAPLGPSTNFSNGITFDHAVLTDPERLVGEPDIAIDHNGGVYVSGPWGTPTQTSWFWKSDDKGTNWHTIGLVPEKSNGQNGGGDTEITIANNNDVFASDAQTLQCNSTFRSFDQGKTFLTGEGCVPESDRNWMGVYDPNSSATGRRIYLSGNEGGLINLFGCYVLVSTDNGVTYQPPNPTGNPSGQLPGAPGCIGRFAVDPTNGDIFAPAAGGTTFASTNGGVTWAARGINSGAGGSFFSPIQIDTAGNLWQVGNNGTKTFLSYSTNRGVTWHSAIQVSTGPGSPIGTSPDIRQVLFPWLSVGDPGRVAIVFYGTTDAGSTGGFPGSVNALWHTYATFSTNAMDANPTFTQVQADEHVMHRGPVCTGGFPGCLTANSDRSMADFFEVEKDPQGRVFIVYNENSDLSQVVPPNAEFPNGQYIGKPFVAVIRLRTGPSLFAAQGNLLPLPTPANVAITSASASSGTLSVAGTHGLPPGNWATDPAGDAIFPVVPTAGPNFGAMDILESSVTDNGTNLTVKMKLADLSATATAAAASLQPVWMVTWWEGKAGLGPANMTSGPFHSHWFMQWLGGTQFVFGEASSVNYATLGAPQPRVMDYVPTGTATGSVVGNEVTISVPLASLGGLVPGDKLDHIHAYALSNSGGGTPIFPVDQAKSFSYVVGTPTAGQHMPDGYIEVSVDNFATSTRATLNSTNNTWTASIPVSASGTVCARQVLAKDLYTPLWDDVQAGPVACTNFTVPIPTLTSVVSRMFHGIITPAFDINLPLAGTRGVECRNSASLGAGNYIMVFTFTDTLTSVAGATIASGTGSVSGPVVVGPNAGLGLTDHQCAVNLTGVSNVQYVSVTLLNAQDSTGAIGNVTGPQMGVLIGDATGNGIVSNAGDVNSVKAQVSLPVTGSNYRNDINANGVISNSGDVAMTKAQVSTQLSPLP